MLRKYIDLSRSRLDNIARLMLSIVRIGFPCRNRCSRCFKGLRPSTPGTRLHRITNFRRFTNALSPVMCVMELLERSSSAKLTKLSIPDMSCRLDSEQVGWLSHIRKSMRMSNLEATIRQAQFENGFHRKFACCSFYALQRQAPVRGRISCVP